MVVWVVVVDLIFSSCNVSQTWIFGRDMQYQRKPVTLQPSPSLTLASSPPHHYRHHVWRWIFWVKILSQDKRARMLSSWYLQCDPGEFEFDSEKANVFGTYLGTLSKVKYREVLTEKNTVSFKHCPNYPSLPPAHKLRNFFTFFCDEEITFLCVVENWVKMTILIVENGYRSFRMSCRMCLIVKLAPQNRWLWRNISDKKMSKWNWAKKGFL